VTNAGTIFYGGFIVEIKKPTTYEEQLAVMRSRGCEIKNEPEAIEFLKYVNYYRLSGYFFSFLQADGMFAEGTTFENVSSLYIFDQDLRALIMKAVSRIELSAKSIISYYHAHQYSELGYIDPESFSERHNHEKFLEQFQAATRNNKNAQFVKHHLRKYNGNFPIWVAAELFTMSMISIFYADLKATDKKAIAKEYGTDYPHLESWLHSASVLRNICAHHGRLYPVLFHQPPKLPRLYIKDTAVSVYSLGRQLCMLKLLYTNWRNEWNNTFILPLSALIEKHEDSINFEIMGFPGNWEKFFGW
jgi:abortive infection bacteriophage resistance protein